MDFQFYADVSRDQMVEMLSDNEEQLVYVISGALDGVTADDVIESGRLGFGIDPELVVFNMRKIADAIEEGAIE